MLDFIKHQKKLGKGTDGVLEEVIIASVLREVLKGLEYFHSNCLIHRWEWAAVIERAGERTPGVIPLIHSAKNMKCFEYNFVPESHWQAIINQKEMSWSTSGRLKQDILLKKTAAIELWD